MNISVIICSIGRPNVLHDTITSILSQTHRPSEILISTPSENHVASATFQLPGVRVLRSRPGLPAQRNDALSQTSSEADLICFLDDDMELCSTYLAQIVDLFQNDPAAVIASGYLLHDGGISTPIDRQSAIDLCKKFESQAMQGNSRRSEYRRFGYGCNMTVRARSVKGIKFDESLPLYAWLEDSDYSFHCTSGTRTALTCLNAVAVHLGWQGGRVSGYRLGFSQIVNPIYIWKKARVFSLPYLVRQFWLRCLIGNVLGTIAGNKEEDRLGRLRGNLLGLHHIGTGRCDPTIAQELYK